MQLNLVFFLIVLGWTIFFSFKEKGKIRGKNRKFIFQFELYVLSFPEVWNINKRYLDKVLEQKSQMYKDIADGFPLNPINSPLLDLIRSLFACWNVRDRIVIGDLLNPWSHIFAKRCDPTSTSARSNNAARSNNHEMQSYEIRRKRFFCVSKIRRLWATE